MDDQCHMKLYRHPPRARQLKLAENICTLTVNESTEDNHPLYTPTDEYYEMIHSLNTRHEPDLSALIDEVASNGYKYDLCPKCNKYDECKHNVYNSEYTILKIVEEKMNCERFKLMKSWNFRRANMLALILYTGWIRNPYFSLLANSHIFILCLFGNYLGCKSQRNGNYDKPKWFDLFLFNGIRLLSNKETGAFSVYTGLNGAQMDSKILCSGFS